MKRKIYLIVLLSGIVTNIIGQDVYIRNGKASFYANKFEGRSTANGEKYVHSKLTAAHLTLPFGTKVMVTNKKNNKSVVVVINDRGPYVQNRIIDLSKSAAQKIDMISDGVANVKVEVINNDNLPVKTSTTKGVILQTVTVNTNEYYQLNAIKIKPIGFGVQIGSYKELVNLMDVSEELQSTFKNKVSVQVVMINGVKVYRIIMGEFKKRAEAENLKFKIQKKYNDCFIVEYQ